MSRLPIETKELAYSLRHPDTGLYWDGDLCDPKFDAKPRRWSKQSQAEQRYADYLVEFNTPDKDYRHPRETWDASPPVLVLVTEEITCTPLSSETLEPIDADNMALVRSKKLFFRHEYEDFRTIVRSSGASTYQFLVKPVMKKSRFAELPRLGDLTKELGFRRSRVVGNSIFVKNEADLLMLKMQGLVEIDHVYDLFSMKLVMGQED